MDAATGVTADSPIAQFASDLAVPLRSNLRRHIRRSGLLAPEQLRDEDVADAVKPYAWLIDRIGVEGLTLTKAGWMPPAVVLEGMTTLGWRDDWIGEANREDLTYPMRELRASAERLRLIRKVKGRLETGQPRTPGYRTPGAACRADRADAPASADDGRSARRQHHPHDRPGRREHYDAT